MSAPGDQGPSGPAPDADEERRYRAVLDLDPAAASAPLLLARLDDPSWRVRSAAAERLAQADPAMAVPGLVAALGTDGSAGRRNAAAAALVQIGAPALAPLVAALASPGADLRTAAVEIMGDLGDRRAVEALAARLRDADANTRAAAAEALGKIGGADAIAALGGCLGAGDPPLRRAALDALARLRAPPPAARLQELAKDRTLRRAALRLAGASDEPAALILLARGLEDPSRTVREAALAGIGQHRLRRAEPLPALAAAVRDAAAGASEIAEAAAAALAGDDVAVRAGAISVLQWAGASLHAAAIAAAADDERLRGLAAAALASLGPAVASALGPALSRFAPAARAVALAALADLGDARVLPELVAALAREDEAVRGPAIEALGRLGDLRAIAALAPLLDHADASVSGGAVAALAELAGRDAVARAEVLAACRSRPLPARPAAYRLLGRIGDGSDLAALRAGLKAPHRGTRVAAAGALAMLGARAPIAGRVPGPELLDALDDGDAAVRAAAAQALGALAPARGPQGASPPGWSEATRALAVALGDDEPVVRAAAALALGRCGAAEYAAQLAEVAGDPAAAPESAAAAVHALSELGRAEAGVLARAARHPDSEVVKEAVLAAAGVPGAPAADLLLAAAAHPRWDVRRAAASALGARGDRALLAALRQLAASEADPLVAEALDAALRRLEARP